MQPAREQLMQVELEVNVDDGAARASVPHVFDLTPAGAIVSIGPGFESHFLSRQTTLFSDGELEVLLVRGAAPNHTGTGSATVTLSGRFLRL